MLSWKNQRVTRTPAGRSTISPIFSHPLSMLSGARNWRHRQKSPNNSRSLLVPNFQKICHNGGRGFPAARDPSTGTSLSQWKFPSAFVASRGGREAWAQVRPVRRRGERGAANGLLDTSAAETRRRDRGHRGFQRKEHVAGGPGTGGIWPEGRSPSPGRRPSTISGHCAAALGQSSRSAHRPPAEAVGALTHLRQNSEEPP